MSLTQPLHQLILGATRTNDQPSNIIHCPIVARNYPAELSSGSLTWQWKITMENHPLMDGFPAFPYKTWWFVFARLAYSLPGSHPHQLHAVQQTATQLGTNLAHLSVRSRQRTDPGRTGWWNSWWMKPWNSVLHCTLRWWVLVVSGGWWYRYIRTGELLLENKWLVAKDSRKIYTGRDPWTILNQGPLKLTHMKPSWPKGLGCFWKLG